MSVRDKPTPGCVSREVEEYESRQRDDRDQMLEAGIAGSVLVVGFKGVDKVVETGPGFEGGGVNDSVRDPFWRQLELMGREIRRKHIVE